VSIVTFERLTLDAHGRSFVADLALPPSGHGPGIVAIHEWWGLNDGIRRMASRLASEGFVVLVPDLYDGEVTDDGARAAELMMAMKTERSMEIVEACVQELARRTGRKVGITGWCMGGAMSFAAAASVPGLSAAVPFYGSARKDYMVAERVNCPIQAHFAEHDGWVNPEAAIAMARDLRAQGGRMEIHFYDAGHAFMREGDAETYHEPSATLAWDRALAFLRHELA
jgi:carboxymethylenebutenolidase